MPRNDDAYRAIAEQICHSQPHWLVLWGSYSRQFWAFPLFEMRLRNLVHASSPEAVIARMNEAERRYRIYPRPEEATQDDAGSH